MAQHVIVAGEISYSRRWNFRKHMPIDPLTLQEATSCNETGHPYCVILPATGGGIAPEAVLEIAWANNHAGVWFFDEVGRQSLNYAFRRAGDRLFLHNMIQYDYPDDAPATLSGATRTDEFRFSDNGIVRRVTIDSATQAQVTEDRSDVDVGSHWEPVPEFGQWASLSRFERD